MGTRRKNQKGGGAWSLPTSSGKIKKIPDGIMKKILDGKIKINPKDEKELLRYTQLDELQKSNYSTRNLKHDLEDVFEKALEKNTSAHKKMENKNLKSALTNIRKMLYKMEIMLINNEESGNLEDVEEKLIQAFVKLSNKVPAAANPALAANPASPANPAAPANPVVPPDTTANPAAADDTNPIVDPDDHGPIGEEAREISGERWKAQKVMANAAAKAKAALGSAGREEAKP